MTEDFGVIRKVHDRVAGLIFKGADADNPAE